MLALISGRQSQQSRDENMNDIVAPNIEQENIFFETDALQPPSATPHRTEENPSEVGERPEPSSNLLNQLTPLTLSMVTNQKQIKKKRRTTIFMDTEKLVPGELMKRRISK